MNYIKDNELHYRTKEDINRYLTNKKPNIKEIGNRDAFTLFTVNKEYLFI